MTDRLTMSEPHIHVCERCGSTWVCEDLKWRVKPLHLCGVTRAVKINGEGPFCTQCLAEIGKEHHERLKQS